MRIAFALCLLPFIAFAQGGVFPTGTGTNSVYGDIDFRNYKATNVSGITLGGEYRTNWPTGGDTNEWGTVITNGLAATNLNLNSGFPLRDTTAITFTNSTRTFTISPVSDSFRFISYGVWFTKATPLSVVIQDIEGLHYIYFDQGGNLTNSTTAWTISGESQVSIVYWDSTNDIFNLFADERHGNSMSDATHLYLHQTIGTRWASGNSLLRNVSAGSPAANGSNTCVAITQGVLYDEDLSLSITTNMQRLGSQSALSTSNDAAFLPVLYATGGVNNLQWRLANTDHFPFPYAASVPRYNQLSGSTWTLTDVPNNYHLVVWVFGTDSVTNPVMVIPHHTVYSLLAQAQSQATPETIFQNRSANLPTAEIKLLYRLIYYRSTSYDNAIKQSALRDVVDYRIDTTRPLNNAPATAHGSLSGLDYDSSGHTGFQPAGDYALSQSLVTVDTNIAFAASATNDFEMTCSKGLFDVIRGRAHTTDTNPVPFSQTGVLTFYVQTNRGPTDVSWQASLDFTAQTFTTNASPGDRLLVVGDNSVVYANQLLWLYGTNSEYVRVSSVSTGGIVRVSTGLVNSYATNNIVHTVNEFGGFSSYNTVTSNMLSRLAFTTNVTQTIKVWSEFK